MERFGESVVVWEEKRRRGGAQSFYISFVGAGMVVGGWWWPFRLVDRTCSLGMLEFEPWILSGANRNHLVPCRIAACISSITTP